MNKIVLCEGKADAIILSYFLIKQYNWEYCAGSTINKSPYFRINKENESFEWYKNNENRLAIWGVGGIDNISQKLKLVIERNSSEPNESKRFTDIVIMFDRDLNTEEQTKQIVKTWVHHSNLNCENLRIGEWIDASHALNIANINKRFSIKMLSIVIPPEGNGALERFLLQALNEQENEKIIFEKTRILINEIKDVSYLSQRRYKDKAHLGCILSIMSPDWVFSFLDERLKRVEWDKLPLVLQTYEKFNKLIEN